MANYKLFIKGDPKNAKRAAARRDIPVRDCTWRRPFGSLKSETTCTVVNPSQPVRVRIMQWFGEHETMRPGRGGAPGSLLFFNGAKRRRRRR